jgi:2-polyprenyl-6-hydroxyphenyl methylase/3-demethylubiquinone-9 3-methyltransferase
MPNKKDINKQDINKNVDQQEINQFSQFASTWWDKDGKFKTLHEINPLRFQYVESKIELKNKKILDIGCGGGIFTESAAQAKAETSGIDLSSDLIEVAKLHLYESNLNVNYQCISAEDFAKKNPEKFDIVTCFEMLEHVPDPKSIIKACYDLAKPGGLVFFSTINRNLKSWALAIIGAEHVLKLIPKGSHHYDKLIRPKELHQWCRECDLNVIEKIGIHYSPFTSRFRLHKSLDINYLLYAQKPE